MEILGRDAPSAFLFHGMDGVAYRKNVRGFVHIPSLRDLNTVTVE